MTVPSSLGVPRSADGGLLRRAPSPASTISPEFDLARAGGMAAEDSVALYRGRVFVLSDLHGGRMLHEHTAGELVVVPAAGTWIHSIEANGQLTAWNSSPTVETITARDYDGAAWSSQPARQLRFPVITTARHPSLPLELQARRIAPGRSACRIVRDDGTVLSRWSCPLTGRGVWSGERLWYVEETWPGQRLVGRGADDGLVIEDHRLPPGNLTSLVADDDQAAAIWSDPSTPAVLVVSPTVDGLVERLPTGGDDRPYRSHWGPIDGLHCVVYTPHGAPVGTLVMLHGGPHALSWPVFSPLISFLCDEGWRIVTPNVSSSAMGSRPQRTACRLGVDDAADVARLAQVFGADGAPVAVAGWSYGAYVAARAVSLGMQCAGIVALGGFFSPEVVAEDHPAVAPFLQTYDLPRTDPGEIGHVPVLAIHGQHDERIRVDAHRAYVQRLPAGTFLDLPDDGHLIITDSGAALAYPALAAWLAGL